MTNEDTFCSICDKNQVLVVAENPEGGLRKKSAMYVKKNSCEC